MTITYRSSPGDRERGRRSAGRRQRSVVVYDSDGINPYGRELATVFEAAGFAATVFAPVDTEWRPPVSSVRTVLPANRPGRNKAAQGLALVHGVAACVLQCVRTRSSCVIVSTRSIVDEAALAILATFGCSVAVICHDPDPKWGHGPIRTFTSRLLQRRATWPVVHSEGLADRLSSRVPDLNVWVVDHPPFSSWLAHALPKGSRKKTGGLSDPFCLLALGALRPDKGVTELPEILALVPEPDRKHMTLRICGRGTLDDPVQLRLRSLIHLDDRSSSAPIPDNAVAAALEGSHILVAPYQGATQSGAVALALSAGLEVLAYDDGALRELISDGGLVPLGDRLAFAGRLAEALHGDHVGTARLGERWADRVTGQWTELLSHRAPPYRTTRNVKIP